MLSTLLVNSYDLTKIPKKQMGLPLKDGLDPSQEMRSLMETSH